MDVLSEWMEEVHFNTFHVVIETLLLVSLVWLFFSRRYRQRPVMPSPLTAKEKQQLLDEWEPEPLCVPPAQQPRQPPVTDGPAGTTVSINGKDLVNVATFNYLGLVKDARIEKAAIQTIEKYGVGSCGPRGFYGTIDVHLELEDRLAKFLGAEEAILYSYGFSTVASAIPAYSKRGDILYIDEAAAFPIQKGAVASRSRVVFFKHNDMDDLEAKLQAQQAEDKKDAARAQATRRFIVTEGIFANTGQLCPLPKLIELKYKYKTRLMVEESHSFGVLGKGGRGIVEHYGVNIEDVDCIAAGMSGALASIGGFCAGRSYVIDHQRLSGQGYCYSASLPPLLATAALESLNVLEASEGKDRLERMHANAAVMRKALQKLPQLDVSGDVQSPLIHASLKDSLRAGLGVADNSQAEDQLLQRVAAEAMQHGAAFTTAAYIWEEELRPHRPSIRIAVSADHTAAELQAAAAALEKALGSILSQ